MSIRNIIENEQNVQIVVNAADLKELILEWTNEKESQIEAMKADVHLTPSEAASALKITKPTLWRWQKAGHLIPIKIAGKVYYKKSDIDRILAGEKS